MIHMIHVLSVNAALKTVMSFCLACLAMDEFLRTSVLNVPTIYVRTETTSVGSV